MTGGVARRRLLLEDPFDFLSDLVAVVFLPNGSSWFPVTALAFLFPSRKGLLDWDFELEDW